MARMQDNGSRLSIERCRELLPGAQAVGDAELLALRDELYNLAAISVEMYLEERSATDQQNAPALTEPEPLISDMAQHKMRGPRDW